LMGDDILRHIARELVDTIRSNTSIDWTVRENVQARMRVAVKKILRKHGYPPDMEAKATETVLEQARMMANGFAKSRTYEIPDNTNISLAAEPD